MAERPRLAEGRGVTSTPTHGKPIELLEFFGIKQLVVLIAVLDDSGTHTDAKYCTCVGVVAGFQQWKRFDREWRRQLDRYGVTDFHAKRFYARDPDGQRVGQFRGWSDEKARKFIGSMTALFVSMKAAVVGATVDTGWFRSLPQNERAFLTGQMKDFDLKTYGTGAPSKPFLLAFSAAVRRALLFGDDKVDLSIALDRSDAYAAQAAIICYQCAKLRGDPIVGVNTFARNDLVPLQLADLIAWLWNRYITKGDLTEEQAFAMSRISRKGDGLFRFDAEGYEYIKQQSPGVLESIGFGVSTEDQS